MFTALVFLNMSLVMVEVCALKLDQDKALIEALGALMSGCSSEEESDFAGLSDEDSLVKEIDFMVSNQLHIPFGHLLESPRKILLRNQGIPRFGNYEIYSPPPEA